jgi:hypothetical protein
MPKESKPRAAKGEGPAKGAKKVKAKKDKDAPKRPLSAYMFFSKVRSRPLLFDYFLTPAQDARESVKADNPEAGFGPSTPAHASKV